MAQSCFILSCFHLHPENYQFSQFKVAFQGVLEELAFNPQIGIFISSRFFFYLPISALSFQFKISMSLLIFCKIIIVIIEKKDEVPQL